MTYADKLLGEWLNDLGGCTCDKAYKDRGLIDPQCIYHQLEFIAVATEEYLSRVKPNAAEIAPDTGHKPCAHCGGEPCQERKTNGLSVIACKECGASTRGFSGIDMAWAAWDKRSEK